MQQPTFDKDYDAIIWDLPAGGFSESIASGKKTFSLFNRNLIKNLPEAEVLIDDLHNVGILFNDGKELIN